MQVPFEITNSVLIAQSIANVAFQFITCTASGSAPVHSDPGRVVGYCVELGAGHCKFGYHFASAMSKLCHSVPKQCNGSIIKVILTDFDEASLRATMALPCFR